MAKVGKRSRGETDYYFTAAKKSKPSRSNRQLAQMEDLPDSEEDLGLSTSVKFLTAAKESVKRNHAAVSNLKNSVEEGKKRLANLVEEKALGVTKRDNELKDALIKVILDVQRDQTGMDEMRFKQSSKSKPTASAIYQSTKSCIASSRELLGHYERASQQVACAEGVPMTESEWEKDSQTLQSILNKQREKIMLEVHQHLNKVSKSSKAQFGDDLSKLDADLWNRFGVGEAKETVKASDGAKGKSWAMVAKNAQRGVRRTVEYLPQEGE